MKQLFKVMKKQPVLVLSTLFLSLLSIAISLLWNYQLAAIINSVSCGQAVRTEVLVNAVLIMPGMILFQSAYTYLSGYTGEVINHSIRMEYAERFLVTDITFFESKNTGEQLSLLQNEIQETSDYISNQLFPLLNDVIKFMITFSWLLYLNAGLTLLANAPVAVILVYIVFTSKIIGALTEESQKETQKMNGLADTILTLFPVIKLYDAGKLFNELYHKRVNNWEKAGIKTERTSAGLMSLSAMLSCIPLLLLLLIGGIDVINGKIEIGVLYIYINLSGNVSGVLMNMPGHIGRFRRFAENRKRTEGE